jgi:uncharacterized protein (TIGR02246 family)
MTPTSNGNSLRPAVAIACLISLMGFAPLAAAIATARTEVETLLSTQAAAWNRGDLEAFCSVYAEDAAFASPKGLTHGRQTILERYRTSYVDRAAMGTLSFEVLEVRQPTTERKQRQPDSCSLLARWRLAYPDKETRSGLTLLVFHRVGGRWLIVQDASM